MGHCGGSEGGERMTNVLPFAPPNRELPHNIEAEQAFLGTVLLDNQGADILPSPLVPDDFYEPVHGRIWGAFQALRTQGRIANPTTLKQYFQTDPANDALNIPDYLKRLCAAAIGSVNVNDYADLIRDLRQKRDLIRACQATAQRANDARPDETAETLAEGLQGDIMRAVGSMARRETKIAAIVQDVLRQTEKAMNQKRPVLGVPTMLADLDAKLGGLNPGDLIILAGRPGMGKSALGSHFSFAAARNKVPTAVFSLEMTTSQWAQRIISARTGIPYDAMRRGSLDTNQFAQMHDIAERLSHLPLTIDDSPALTLAAIRARAMRAKAQHGLGLVIVDYLGLVKPDDRYSGNKVHEVGQISGGLKALAKDLDVPVVALAQLNRANEARDDKRPGLSDLRNSGDIEQDADIVMFVFREEYYLERKQPQPPGTPEHVNWAANMRDVANITEIIVAKNRQGSVGTVRVFGDMATSRYNDLQRSE